MIRRLYATQCGATRFVLDPVPDPRVIQVDDVLRYDGLAPTIDGPGAASEAALFGAREPTF